MIGALAVVTLATQIDQTRLAPAFRWLGEHSIVIYLAFFLPMAASRAILMKSGIVGDVGTISLLVTLAGITAPIALLFPRPVDGRRQSSSSSGRTGPRIDGRYRQPRAALVPAE